METETLPYMRQCAAITLRLMKRRVLGKIPVKLLNCRVIIRSQVQVTKTVFRINVVEILLAMDPDLVNIANEVKETPLYLASERQYTEIVRKILEKVESVEAYQGPNDRTALHAAVSNGDIGLTRYLLENEHLRGAVKHPDKKSWVPLHYAVYARNESLTKFLLEQDENTAYMQDSEGRTPLHIAALCDHKAIFEMIIRYYPDCSELVDNKGCNALHYVVDNHCYATLFRIKRYLWLSNLYSEKDKDGNTPLHHLAKSTTQCDMWWVLHPRVDKLALNKEDQTPLDLAYSTLEDTDRPLRKQEQIWQLKNFGGKQGQRGLKVKSNDMYIASLEFTKEAKESHLIVATLIATVTFAAAFTPPGGNWQDGKFKGTPILADKASFKAFIVSDTIALVMSASAALIHLFSPLKKANWLDHYLSQGAFSFILVALVAMFVAFGTGTYTVLGPSSTGIAVIFVALFFFLVFRQALEMSFKLNSLLVFVINLVNVICFPFIIFSPIPFGGFFLLFKTTKQAEKEDSAPSTNVNQTKTNSLQPLGGRSLGKLARNLSTAAYNTANFLLFKKK